MGLLLLFILAALLLLILAVLATVHAAIKPARAGLGQALALNLPTTPGDLGLSFESWTCCTEDGLHLPVWDVEGVAGGPTLLWLHDHGGSRLSDLRQLADWMSWCERALLVDLRGHGDAPGSCTLGMKEPGDVDRLLECLEDGQVILGGRGFGAVLALDAACRHQGDIAAWAITPYPSTRTRWRQEMRRRSVPTWPLYCLGRFVLRIMGRHSLEPPAESPSERIRIVDGNEPIPREAWWTGCISGDSSSN